MKKLALIMAVFVASAAFAAEPLVDRDPNVIPSNAATPLDYNPAWGSTIRSFSCVAYPGGIANTYDGYVITGHWGTSFTAWYVYTETGSLVRTVSGLSGNSGGFRGGSAHNHLGTGYIVSAQYTGGCNSWTYAAGGNPGTTGTALGIPAAGRGISWDGTYYYATTGTYSTPIGIYTSTGSQVGTVPGTVHTLGIYDNATHYPGNGYMYVSTQSPNVMREVDLTTGNTTRSFAETGFNAGCDLDWDADAIWSTLQASPGYVFLYDGPGHTGVQPSSLGNIKALYR
ncbi:MAG: hypothetical protein PVH29_10285 [Candidatus Zixiibacteriota bacterium]